MPNKILDLHKVDAKTFPYIFEENATVSLKSSEDLVRVNVYRPKDSDSKPVPVLVTYGPSAPFLSHPPSNCLTSNLDTAKTSPTKSSTSRASQKSIRSIKAPTRLGRRQIPNTGQSMATLSSALMNGGQASLPACSTPCPAVHQRRSST